MATTDDEARFQEVLRQFAAVDPDAAGKCAERIEVWLEPRREAQKQLDELDQERQTLERELKQLRAQEDIARLQNLRQDLKAVLTPLEKTWKLLRERLDFERRAEYRAEARKALHGRINALTHLKAWLDELTAPSEETLKRLTDAANWALARFSLVPGLYPLRLVREEADNRAIFKVRAQDGRDLEQLSTGQRAQFGIALLVAQNREVSELLPHRALFLDDVSTAYDLSNLTREALLWRQLAYGAKEPFRRQIFIAGHHEDMTDHLLDLLVPPSGSRMRVIRITDWSPETGPTLETFQVEPTASTARDGDTVRPFVQSVQQENHLWRTESNA